MPTTEVSEFESLTPAIILEEDNDHPPTEAEIRLYASSIGIDVDHEPHLLPIAREGISAPLPSGWQVLQDENSHIFYYNGSTGISLWEHPLDPQFRQKVNEVRRLFNHKPVEPEFGDENYADDVENSHFLPQVSQKKYNLESRVMKSPTSSPRTTNTSRSSLPLKTPLKQIMDNRPVAPSNGLHQDEKEHANHIPGTKSPLSGDEPTEYLSLKPSARTQSSLLLNTSPDIPPKIQTACQTDQVDFLDSKQWSETYSRALHQAEGRLSLLQSKLRESLSANKKVHSTKPTKSSVSTSCLKSSQTDQSGQHSTLISRKSSRSCEHLADLDRFVTASPPFIRDRMDSDGSFLNFAPELGTSPSEVKSPLQNDPDSGFVAPGEQANPIESKVSTVSPSLPALGQTNDKNNTQTNVAYPTEELAPKLTPSISDNKSQPSPTIQSLNEADSLPNVGVQVGFSEGIGHIVEERSRIQRKLLKLKLIYKTYKQRLASLDASLSILQQSTLSHAHTADRLPPNKADPNSAHYQTPTMSHLQVQQTLVTPSNYPVITPLSTNVSAFSLSPNSVNKDKVTPTISRYPCPHSLGVSSKPYMNSPDTIYTSTSTVSPSVETGISCRTNSSLFHKYRRSFSAPRSSVDALRRKCDLHSTSIYSPLMHSHNRSMSQELANSLASIDNQLHRVLNQLDINDDDTVQKYNAHG